MVKVIARRLFGFFVPGGLILLAGFWFTRSPAVLHWRPLALKISLLLLPVLALLLGWRFNRSKPVYLILVLVLAERVLHYYSSVGFSGRAEDMVIIRGLALLLPLNFIVLGLGAERGMFTVYSLPRILFVVIPPLLILFVSIRHPLILAYFQSDLLPFELPRLGNLTQTGHLAFFMASVFLLVRLIYCRGAMANGFFWALVTSWIGLTCFAGLQLSVFLAAACLILIGTIVEDAHTMAFRDELTGLPSRRALNEYFLRLSGTYAVAMLDVDFFKKFNDTYGHDVGDQVLKMVATRVARVKGGGRPFRYGGEEFTVVFPGRTGKEVMPHLENLRRSIQDSGFTLRGPARKKQNRKSRGAKTGADNQVGVTISIGVADRHQRRQTPEEVLKKADQALYAAKKAGRNRIEG